jgi:hypothetical protein
MIKGCQKKIILLKDTGSDFFEEAYFILKSDATISKSKETDMVKAATKIVTDSLTSQNKEKKKVKLNSKAINFMIGALCGAIVCGMLFLFI